MWDLAQQVTYIFSSIHLHLNKQIDNALPIWKAMHFNILEIVMKGKRNRTGEEEQRKLKYN